MSEDLISIVIPFKAEVNDLERCLESIVNQTYKNLEIIIVNDGSQKDLSDIKKKYENTRVLTLPENVGSLEARIIGARVSKGDYLLFIDSDDTISLDWVRALYNKIKVSRSDIVIGQFLYKFPSGNYTFLPLSDLNNRIIELKDQEILKTFFSQQGQDFAWHVLWNKIYSRDVIIKSIKVLEQNLKERCVDRLIMCEDVLWSSIIFSFAKKITNLHNNYYFYTRHSNNITSPDNSFEKTKKNVLDICVSFDILTSFLKTNKLSQFIDDSLVWKDRILLGWRNNARSLLKEKEFKEIYDLISKNIDTDFVFNKAKENYFYKQVPFTDFSYERIKNELKKCSVFSIDVFDTAVLRPFLDPEDLFNFMETQVSKILNTTDILDFSSLRIQAEKEARSKSDNEEISLDSIYSELGRILNCSINKIDKIKQLEIDLEIKLSYRRESVFELYELANYLKKKIVFVSDMYLPGYVIEKILNKAGYKNFELLVSSEVGKTKHNQGKLFEEILPIEGGILHIGDNIKSDFEIPISKGISAFHYKKASSLFFNINNGGLIKRSLMPFLSLINGSDAYLSIGIRSILGVIANKIYDNPYTVSVKNSDLNLSPYYFGYFPLGLYALSIAKWIHSNSDPTKNVHFISRDGWLVKEIYKVLYPEQSCDYLYASRLSLFPLLIRNSTDLLNLKNEIKPLNFSISELLSILFPNLKFEVFSGLIETCEKNNLNFDKKFENISEYDTFIKILKENFNYFKGVDKSEQLILNYLSQSLNNGDSTFDVGYSFRLDYLVKKNLGINLKSFIVHTQKSKGLKRENFASLQTMMLYPFTPNVTGPFREFCLSETSPSCTGYQYDQMGYVKPLFDFNKEETQVTTLTNIFHQASIDLARDLKQIFQSDLNCLIYKPFDGCLPFEVFNQSPNPIDLSIFEHTTFEDKLTTTNNVDLRNFWRWQTMLSSFKEPNNNELLSQARWKKAIYYALFDFPIFKEKIKNKIRNKKILFFILRRLYRISKKVVK